jgi:hypothetical protein
VDLARPNTLAEVRAALKPRPAAPPSVEVKAAIMAHVAKKFKRAGR